MAGGDVERLRRGYQAWQEGGVEAIVPFLAENIEWIQDPAFPGAETWHGHEGVRAWDELLAEGWTQRRVEVEELIPCGAGRVLALLRLDAIGRHSGVVVRTPLAHLWTFRDGLAVRVQFYLDHERAREAAGV